MTVNVERVNKAGEGIQRALQRYSPGWANTEALRDITRLADEALHASGYDGYVAEKVAKIKDFASILYSPRKHQRYSQGSRSGVDRVRDFVFGEAYVLADWGPPSRISLHHESRRTANPTRRNTSPNSRRKANSGPHCDAKRGLRESG